MAEYIPPATHVAEEQTNRTGSLPLYVHFNHAFWLDTVMPHYDPAVMPEVFFTMLLGMALFKWGVTQGERSAGFYAELTLCGYLPGIVLGMIADSQTVAFQALPNIGYITDDFARVAVTLGHLGLVNLLFKSHAGRSLLAPFKAAGRTAFSLYLMQNFVGIWILFPRFGLGLYGRFHWCGLTMLALGFTAGQLVLANLWLRYVAISPLEWLWRSLSDRRRQPFLRTTRANLPL